MILSYPNQKKLFRNIVVVSLLIVLTSCSEKREFFLAEEVHSFSTFPQVDTLTFNNLFEHEYSNVDRLILKDSLLITKNNHGRSRKGPNFTSYNLSTFEHYSFIPYGKGPGEVLGAFSCGFINDNFWVNDITARKILLIKSKDIVPGQLDRDNGCVNISLSKNNIEILGQGFFINDTTYICKVEHSKSKSKLIEVELPNCEITEEYGQFNQDQNHEMFSLNRDAYMGASTLFVKPDNNNIVAISYAFTDKFEFLNLKSNEDNAFWGPHQIENEFDVTGTGPGSYPLRNDKTQITYVGGYATTKYLYLIYSGNYFRKSLSSSGLDTSPKNIYVFDWTGKPVKKIVWKKDISIRAIAVSEDEETLYGYDESNNYIVTAKLK